MSIRLSVAGLIYREHNHEPQLLLGRRGGKPNKGLFVLPGGGVNEGETLDEALAREIFEETGLTIKSKIGTWKNPDVIEILGEKHSVILVGEAVAEEGQPKTKDKSDLYDIGFYSKGEIPNDLSPVIVPVLLRAGWIK